MRRESRVIKFFAAAVLSSAFLGCSGGDHTGGENMRLDIRAICAVSDSFVPVLNPKKLTDSQLDRYLAASARRLDIIRSKFGEEGYTAEPDEFYYKGRRASNVIFRRARKAGPETWIIAHHDHCAALGADDNASALAVMLELARRFRDSDKNLVFASFDMEEAGLSGSKRFVKGMREEAIRKIKQVIDLEVLGSGRDMIICKSVYAARCDAGLVERIKKISSRLGYEFIPQDFDFFWSDLVPFAQKGIKTVEICSLDYEAYLKFGGRVAPERKDGVTAHTDRDLPENIKTENLLKVLNTLAKFIEESA